MSAGTESITALLSRVSVFEDLSEGDLGQVAEVAVPRRYPAGHVIFREGDDSDTCYVVRQGHARALREHSDGRVLTLATFGPGDTFGELAMFDDERRSATVQAIDELETIAVLGPDMRRLLREHPAIAAKLVISLGRRLRAANERLTRQSFQTVQSRVAAVLAQLVRAGAQRGRRGRRRDAAHHPGRPGPARGLLARVGEPLPGRARARRASSPRAAAGSPSTTRTRSRAMSTDGRRPVEQEVSYGGVAVRDATGAEPPRWS